MSENSIEDVADETFDPRAKHAPRTDSPKAKKRRGAGQPAAAMKVKVATPRLKPAAAAAAAGAPAADEEDDAFPVPPKV